MKKSDVDADNFMGEIVVSEPGSEEEEKVDEKEEAKTWCEEKSADTNDSVVIKMSDPGKKLLIESQHIGMPLELAS